MGGYVLPDGRKMQADDYIEWLESERERLERIVGSVRSKTALDVVAEKLQAQDVARRLRDALETAQGEAYLGTLDGADMPDPLAACHNVISVCLAALEVERPAEAGRPDASEGDATKGVDHWKPLPLPPLNDHWDRPPDRGPEDRW